MNVEKQTTLRPNARIALLIIAAACLLVIILLLMSMNLGPGVGGDATIYITTARNLAAGKGLVLIEADGSERLLPYFPPFYPIMLSLFEVLGISSDSASVWLNVLLFAGLVAMAGWSVWRLTCSLPAVAAGSFLLAFSPVLISVYSWTMSEPLSILLGFASFVCLDRGIYSARRPGGLVLAAGLLAGLSFLTRYGSVAFLATGVIWLLLRWFKDRAAGFKDLLVYSIFGSLPMLLWLVYDVTQTATVASRRLLALSEIPARLASFFPPLRETLLFWLLPDSFVSSPPYPLVINSLIALGMLLLILAMVARVLLRKHETDAGKAQGHAMLAPLLAIFIVIYGFVILATYLTTYPPITIGGRMFSPLFVAVAWLFALLLPRFLSTNRVLRVLLILSLVAFLGLYGLRTARIARGNQKFGLGYNAVAWQESVTIAAVRDLPPEAVLVSNESNAILYLTGRTSYPFKEVYVDQPQLPFTAYGSGALADDAGQALFAGKEAMLVLFDTIEPQFASIYGDQTGARISALVQGLKPVFKGDDGKIFVAP